MQQIGSLSEAGQDPFAYSYPKDHSCQQLQQQYAHLEAGEELPDGPVVHVAGRVRARRRFGKLMFVKLEDESGDIQLYVDKKLLAETQPEGFRTVKDLLDVGDIVGARGWIKVCTLWRLQEWWSWCTDWLVVGWLID